METKTAVTGPGTRTPTDGSTEPFGKQSGANVESITNPNATTELSVAGEQEVIGINDDPFQKAMEDGIVNLEKNSTKSPTGQEQQKADITSISPPKTEEEKGKETTAETPKVEGQTAGQTYPKITFTGRGKEYETDLNTPEGMLEAKQALSAHKDYTYNTQILMGKLKAIEPVSEIVEILTNKNIPDEKKDRIIAYINGEIEDLGTEASNPLKEIEEGIAEAEAISPLLAKAMRLQQDQINRNAEMQRTKDNKGGITTAKSEMKELVAKWEKEFPEVTDLVYQEDLYVLANKNRTNLDTTFRLLNMDIINKRAIAKATADTESKFKKGLAEGQSAKLLSETGNRPAPKLPNLEMTEAQKMSPDAFDIANEMGQKKLGIL